MGATTCRSASASRSTTSPGFWRHAPRRGGSEPGSVPATGRPANRRLGQHDPGGHHRRGRAAARLRTVGQPDGEPRRRARARVRDADVALCEVRVQRAAHGLFRHPRGLGLRQGPAARLDPDAGGRRMCVRRRAADTPRVDAGRRSRAGLAGLERSPPAGKRAAVDPASAGPAACALTWCALNLARFRHPLHSGHSPGVLVRGVRRLPSVAVGGAGDLQPDHPGRRPARGPRPPPERDRRPAARGDARPRRFLLRARRLGGHALLWTPLPGDAHADARRAPGGVVAAGEPTRTALGRGRHPPERNRAAPAGPRELRHGRDRGRTAAPDGPQAELALGANRDDHRRRHPQGAAQPLLPRRIVPAPRPSSATPRVPWPTASPSASTSSGCMPAILERYRDSRRCRYSGRLRARRVPLPARSCHRRAGGRRAPSRTGRVRARGSGPRLYTPGDAGTRHLTDGRCRC